MSYACVDIIYGIPLTPAIHSVFQELDDDCIDNYFEVLYTASGDINPGYCGVKLAAMDECTDYTALSDITKPPTQAQMKEAMDKIDQLPEEVKAVMKMPDVYLIWYSS